MKSEKPGKFDIWGALLSQRYVVFIFSLRRCRLGGHLLRVLCLIYAAVSLWVYSSGGTKKSEPLLDLGFLKI